MNKQTGYAITVRIDEERNYAEDFLRIFNNVRVDRDLLKITNDDHRGITVTCIPAIQARFTRWLEQFGEIVDIDKVLLVEIEEVDFDCFEYDDICYYVEH